MFSDDKEMQRYFAEDFIELRQHESEEELLGRIEDFRCWLLFGYTSKEHVEVEEWAIEEFKKQRKRIRDIIKNWKE